MQIYALNYYYLPWKHMNEAIPHIEDHFDVYRSRIDWTVDLSDSSAHYNRNDDEITFGDPTYRAPITAGHEFGHALHNEKLGGTWAASNCKRHYTHLPSSYKCALKEGFADYAAWVGEEYPENWENKHYTSDDGEPGEIEGNVAALFHDLIDPNNEGDDETNYSGELRGQRAPNLPGFGILSHQRRVGLRMVPRESRQHECTQLQFPGHLGPQ